MVTADELGALAPVTPPVGEGAFDPWTSKMDGVLENEREAVCQEHQELTQALYYAPDLTIHRSHAGVMGITGQDPRVELPHCPEQRRVDGAGWGCSSAPAACRHSHGVCGQPVMSLRWKKPSGVLLYLAWCVWKLRPPSGPWYGPRALKRSVARYHLAQVPLAPSSSRPNLALNIDDDSDAMLLGQDFLLDHPTQPEAFPHRTTKALAPAPPEQSESAPPVKWHPESHTCPQAVTSLHSETGRGWGRDDEEDHGDLVWARFGPRPGMSTEESRAEAPGKAARSPGVQPPRENKKTKKALKMAQMTRLERQFPPPMLLNLAIKRESGVVAPQSEPRGPLGVSSGGIRLGLELGLLGSLSGISD